MSVQESRHDGYKSFEMADYATIDPRAFGRTYAVPHQIRRLPVDLLRSALATRDPQAVGRATEQYRQAVTDPNFTSPRVLPQRMMFQQHKSQYAGGISRPGTRDPLSSATTVTRALAPTVLDGSMQSMRGLSATPVVAMRVPERVPTYAEAAAADARGGSALPIPAVAPIPKSMLRTRPMHQYIEPPLQAYGDDLAEAQNRAAAEAAFRAGNAMRSVEEAKARVRQILMGKR